MGRAVIPNLIWDPVKKPNRASDLITTCWIPDQVQYDVCAKGGFETVINAIVSLSLAHMGQKTGGLCAAGDKRAFIPTHLVDVPRACHTEPRIP